MYFTAVFVNNGIPATGLSPLITIYRVSDNAVLVNAQAMSEIGNGFYKYNYSGYSKLVPVVAIMDANTDITNRYVFAGNRDDLEIQDAIDRIMGTVLQNSVMEFTFTGDNQTSGGLWLYDSKANAQTHNKSTGLIGVYSFDATFSSGKPTIARWVRES